MNKFIILTSFLVVFSIHFIILFSYKNPSQTTILKPQKETYVQIQLSKVNEKKEEKIIEQPTTQIEKKVEPKKVEQKREKPIEKKIAKKVEIIEKKDETKETETIVKEEKQTISKETIPNIQNTPIEKVNKPDKDIEEEKLINEYSRKLREAINENKTYPNISRKLKEEGKVIVRFKVLKNGKFTDIHILVSSNKERLDKAALNALYETKEFEPFSNKLNKEFLEYNIPLEFILN